MSDFDHGWGSGDGPRSELSGHARDVVQGRDIHGGVHFHQHAGPESVVAPAQLPPAPSRFTNRDTELKRLDTLLSESPDGTPLVVVLVGVGGVGKTALALRWLNRIGRDFVGGQLYIDLGGFSGTDPIAPSVVLGGFLRALGAQPESVSGSLGELAAHYRSLTADRRVVVFADNAASAAQVRALVPSGAESLVVVTTRRRIAGLAMDGAEFVEIGPLTERAAVSLLEEIAGSGRVAGHAQESREVVGLCGRLPLAVRASAARLAMRRRWDVRRLAVELGDERRRLSALEQAGDVSIRAAFDISYRGLPPEPGRAYRCLGLVPGRNITVGLAAAALDASPDAAAELLDELVDASLLEEGSDDGWRFHDLVRVHAREKAEAQESPEDQAEVLHRILDWYLASANAADAVLMPYRQARPRDPVFPPAAPATFTTREEALAWLDANRIDLVSAVRHAQQDSPRTAWQLVDALWPLASYLAQVPERIELARLGVAAADACADPHAQAKMSNQLGLALLAEQRYDEAEHAFLRALQSWRELGEQRRIAGSLRRLAMVADRRGHFEEAASGLNEAQSIYRARGELRKVALALIDLGSVLQHAGRAADAVPPLEEAIRLLGSETDPANRARALTKLAQVRMALGERGSEDLLADALELMREAGSAAGRAEVLEALGDSAADRRAPTLAGEHYEQAVRLWSTLASPDADRVREKLRRLAAGG